MIPATAVDRFLSQSSLHACGVSSLSDIPLEAGTATHPLARPVVRLPLYAQGVGRIRKAAKAATTPLSLLLAYRGRLRLRFAADTRPNAPLGVSDYGC